MEKGIYVIKAGETFEDLKASRGDFEDWIISGMGLDPGAVTVINAEGGEPLPAVHQVRGAVISGSHAMVTQDLAWSLALEAWTREMVSARIPLLGICYGHQILARALGGRVDFHPGGTEIGTRMIRCHGACGKDPLFTGLPEAFRVHLFHSQSVLGLPQGAVLLAGGDFDPHQAFRAGSCAWGVQFHPEADAGITRGYIRNLEAELTREGQDIGALKETLEETPEGSALLRRFAGLVLEG